MKKLILLALCLLTLTGCSVSPYVVTVGSERIDASEAAFYLYNAMALAEENGEDLTDQTVRDGLWYEALDQMAAASAIRQSCADLGIRLPEEALGAIAETKEALISGLGGAAGYRDWLRQSHMTDRLYDKLQADGYYFSLLQDHVTAQLERDPLADQVLRRFFSDNYTRVRYIRLSRFDPSGMPYDRQTLEQKLEQAKALLLQLWAGADFPTLMEAWNDDPQMAEGSLVVTRSFARDTDYLAAAFTLEEEEIAGVYLAADGYYILQRLPLAANWYDAHQEEIFREALEVRFAQFLQEAEDACGVTAHKDFWHLDLDNLDQYIK